MEEFNPFGWLEKYLPARIIHLLIRISIIAVLIFFLIQPTKRIKFFHLNSNNSNSKSKIAL